MTLSNELPPVLWLGGGSGAGKTTIARTIALRFDLAWYRVDAYAYEHQDRLIARGLVKQSATTQDERWLAPNPTELAERFVTAVRRLFPLILDDLRALDPTTGVIAEGPQLFLSLVAPHLASPEHGLWLLPTEEFQRRSLENRTGDSARFTSDAMRALDNRIARNRLLEDRTCEEAKALGLTVIDVDGQQDLAAMVQRVTDHFPVADVPAARSGDQRSSMRRMENDAMIRNVRAFVADLGPDAPPEWALPFPCECEQLGCTELTERAPTEYQQFRSAGRPITAH